MDGEAAEHLAWQTSQASGFDDRPRCDPRKIAVNYCELTLAPWPKTKPRLVDGVIWYPSDAPENAQAYYVAHEVGHDVIAHAGYKLDRETEERAASRIAVGLLLPRPRYLRDLHEHGWDLEVLRTLWPLASPWVHARRIAEVTSSGAVASRWSRRGCVDRIATDDVPRGVTVLERTLARAALAGGPLEAGPRMRAWRVETEAIVVCGAEELHAMKPVR